MWFWLAFQLLFKRPSTYNVFPCKYNMARQCSFTLLGCDKSRLVRGSTLREKATLITWNYIYNRFSYITRILHKCPASPGKTFLGSYTCRSIAQMFLWMARKSPLTKPQFSGPPTPATGRLMSYNGCTTDMCDKWDSWMKKKEHCPISRKLNWEQFQTV